MPCDLVVYVDKSSWTIESQLGEFDASNTKGGNMMMEQVP